MIKLCFRKAKQLIITFTWTSIVVTVACMLVLSGQLSKRHTRNVREKFWFENEDIVENFKDARFNEMMFRDVSDVGLSQNLAKAEDDNLDKGDGSEKNIALALNERRIQNLLKKTPNQVSSEQKIRMSSICDNHNKELFGQLEVDSKSKVSLEEAVFNSGSSLINGCYVPECHAVQKVAIVIPYKNRYEHLLMLTKHLHPILQRQKVMYCIFVAEQFDDGSFNKAQIMNAAFKEITTNFRKYGHPEDVDSMTGGRRGFDCFVFHDVDMLVENDKNIYMCEDDPKHMSPSIDKFNYSSNYGTIYGGVTAMKTEMYQLVNGHSNNFWGWGGEDNDMEKRIELAGRTIIGVNATIGRFKMIKHEHPWWFSPETGNGSWKTKQKKAPPVRPKDPRKKGTSGDEQKKPTDKYSDTSGLSDVKYQLIKYKPHLLWTKIVIDIRSHVFEMATSKFVDHNVNEITVTSPEIVTAHMSKDIQADQDNDELDTCVPKYHKFEHMTVNHTRKDTDNRYYKIYYDLNEAKEACNKLMRSCQAIQEQRKGTYTLRSTAFVQENKLHYKLDLIRQVDIFEDHHTTAVYVKQCLQDINFVQFVTDPILIRPGMRRANAPHFNTNFTIRLLQPSNQSYTYRTRIMTTHRAIMEAKVAAKILKGVYWDSLGKFQYKYGESFTIRSRMSKEGKFNLLDFSNPEQLRKYQVQGDASSKGPIGGIGTVYQVQSPNIFLDAYPGCYLIKHSIVNEGTEKPAFEWSSWVQVRGETEEDEKHFLDEQLAYSVHIGEEYRKLQEKNKSLLRLYPQLNKKPKEESDSKKPAVARMKHKRPMGRPYKEEDSLREMPKNSENAINIEKDSSTKQLSNNTILR